MPWKNTDNCKKCPKSNAEPDGCVKWWEYPAWNKHTGEQGIRKGCMYQLLPELLMEVAQNTFQVGAAVESNRNETAHGLTQLVNVVRYGQEQLLLGVGNGEDEQA